MRESIQSSDSIPACPTSGSPCASSRAARACASAAATVQGVQLIVAVNAAPVDGAANEAVIRAVAKAFGLRPRQVTLVSGQTARTKTLALSIDDADAGLVAARLAELLDA